MMVLRIFVTIIVAVIPLAITGVIACIPVRLIQGCTAFTEGSGLRIATIGAAMRA